MTSRLRSLGWRAILLSASSVTGVSPISACKSTGCRARARGRTRRRQYHRHIDPSTGGGWHAKMATSSVSGQLRRDRTMVACHSGALRPAHTTPSRSRVMADLAVPVTSRSGEPGHGALRTVQEPAGVSHQLRG
jgi:hypothetical protein